VSWLDESSPNLCVSWTNGHLSATISDVPVSKSPHSTASYCSVLPKSNEEMLKINFIFTQHISAVLLGNTTAGSAEVHPIEKEMKTLFLKFFL